MKCPQGEKTSTIDLIKDMSDSWEAYETKGFIKKISVRGGLAWVYEMDNENVHIYI